LRHFHCLQFRQQIQMQRRIHQCGVRLCLAFRSPHFRAEFAQRGFPRGSAARCVRPRPRNRRTRWLRRRVNRWHSRARGGLFIGGKDIDIQRNDCDRQQPAQNRHFLRLGA
jgi:hypothetical protein